MATEKLNGIQALRFVAASMVVVLHSTYFVHERGNPQFGLWKPGYYGVHIFFVISGLVMVLGAERLRNSSSGAAEFFRRRLVRIVPLYWIVNSVKLAIVFLIPSVAVSSIDASNVVASFLFVPALASNGKIEPFYGVGWTLNFEVAFYAAFALALWSRKSPTIWLSPLLIGLATLSLVKSPAWGAIAFYCDPIVLNFMWGMMIGASLRQGHRLSAPLATALAAIGFAIILLAPDTRMLGLQFAAVVLGVAHLEFYIADRIPKLLLRGGAASYALYLSHPIVGPAIALVGARLEIAPAVIVPAIWAVSTAAGLLVFARVEAPTARLINRLWTPPYSGRNLRPDDSAVGVAGGRAVLHSQGTRRIHP